MSKIGSFRLIPVSWNSKITLLVTIAQALIVTILEVVVFNLFINSGVDFQAIGPARGVPVYLTIFILAQVFQIVLVWDAVIHENTIQMIGFCGFNLAICSYSIFQYEQLRRIVFSDVGTNHSTLNSALIAIPIVTGVGCLVLFYLMYLLYQEFGWKVYKRIGADPQVRDMYRMYQIFVLLVKLDVFFATGFGVQFLVLVLDSKNDPEFPLTIAAIPIMLMVLATAVYGVKSENRIIVGGFLVGLLAAIAYFIFKLVRIYTKPEKYVDTKYFLTFFAALSLGVVTANFITTMFCMNHFGKGLKEHLMKEDRRNSPAP